MEVEADARLRRRLVMSRFVELEGIEVSRAEVDAEVRRVTRSLPRAARRDMPSDNEMRQGAGSRILTSRALDRLLAIAAGDEDDEGEPAEASEGSDESTSEQPDESTSEQPGESTPEPVDETATGDA
jgi:FKBP-type peptidyl-prolyl cis-trans isomerase (trigger factor)